MKILSLDQARICGYAFGETGALPKTFLLQLGKTGTPSGVYLWTWAQRLKELVERYDPDLVAYERPFFSAKTAASGERLLKMAGIIEVVCYGKRIETMQIDNSSWKKTFTGSAKFSKETTPYPPVLECELRGIEIDGSHDRADAAGIWFHAAIKHDPKGMANLDTPLFGRVK